MKLPMLNVVVLILCSWSLDLVSGHGRMIEPAARNVMWRYDYKNPRNYNDMGLNCGGFTNQFEQHAGKCGACGDPWQGPREHEAGGKYARGMVARQYPVGAYINVTLELTSNHMGYFEFRLCPVNNPMKRATQACLDQHILNIAGHGRRYFIQRQGTNVFEELAVMLPPSMQCSQCVLQWKWVAGQSMGPDGYGGECLGCGNQENFINCADIAIGNNVVAPLPPLPADASPPTPQPAPAGPAYDTYNNAAPAGNSAGNQPNMAVVKQIVNKLLKRANPLQQSGTSPPPQSSWNGPSYNAPTARPVPQTPPTQAPWTMAPPTPSWKAPPTPSPANTWQQPSGHDWFGGAPNNYQPTPPQEYNYPGYEPGEYPEPGEGPTSGSSSHGSSSYMQGYGDAMRQLKEQFGMNNGMGEVSVHLQESQKQSAPSYNSPPRTCPDGSEPECRAVNPAQSSLFDSFCSNACQNGPDQCPKELCTCSCSGSGGGWSENMGAMVGQCRALDRTKGASMDTWCTQNCQRNNCPSELCVCG